VSEPRQGESPEAAAAAQVCLVERDAALGERVVQALGGDGSLRVTLLGSASDALEHLLTHPCDVVVAADDLAESGCATLLRRVQHEYPEAMRVVLSDRDGVDVFRRVPYAHQFFGRSATPEALKVALGQCLDVRSLIQRAPLRALVSGSNALPAAPKLYGRSVPLAVAEHETFGATGAAVAAYLLAIWGQPLEVVRAIAHQDVPERCDQGAPGMATLIYISKRLGQNPDAPLSDDPAVPLALSEAFLAQVGVLDQLPSWRAVARRLSC